MFSQTDGFQHFDINSDLSRSDPFKLKLWQDKIPSRGSWRKIL